MNPCCKYSDREEFQAVVWGAHLLELWNSLHWNLSNNMVSESKFDVVNLKKKKCKALSYVRLNPPPPQTFVFGIAEVKPPQLPNVLLAYLIKSRFLWQVNMY